MGETPSSSEERRLVLVGAGPVGTAAVAAALEDGAAGAVAAAVDPDEAARDAAVRDLGGVGLGSLDELVAGYAAVAVVAFSSRALLVAPVVERLLDLGMDVVTTCEELARPAATVADSLGDACRRNACRAVVTGANPGFAMDRLPVLLAGGTRDVRRVVVTRRVDTATRRKPLRAKSGFGLTIDDFHRGVAEGTVGHVGLEESAGLVADALGWTIEDVSASISPVVGSDGTALGQRQELLLTADAGRSVELHLTMAWQVDDPTDLVEISGDPDLRAEVPGGYPGDEGTAARVVNALRAVARLRPGLYRPTDLPLEA